MAAAFPAGLKRIANEGILRHDAGNPLGIIKASVSLALKRPDLGSPLKEWLQSKLEE